MISLSKLGRYRNEGIAFNAIYGIYILFLSTQVSEEVWRVVSQPDYTAPSLGLLLSVLLVLHFWALLKKLKIVVQATRDEKMPEEERIYGSARKKNLSPPMGLFVFHLLTVCVLAIIILFLFGLVEQGESGLEHKFGPGFSSGTMIGVSLLAIACFVAALLIVNKKEEQKERSRPQKMEFLYDIILLSYAALSHSAFWGLCFGSKPPMGLIEASLLELGGYFLLFTFVYSIIFLPARLPYFLEEYMLIGSRKELLKFAFGWGFVLAAAFYDLYRIYL